MRLLFFIRLSLRQGLIYISSRITFFCSEQESDQ